MGMLRFARNDTSPYEWETIGAVHSFAAEKAVFLRQYFVFFHANLLSLAPHGAVLRGISIFSLQLGQFTVIATPA